MVNFFGWPYFAKILETVLAILHTRLSLAKKNVSGSGSPAGINNRDLLQYDTTEMILNK